MMMMEVVKTAVKVSTVSIVVNVTLSLLKLAAGIIGQSMAMLSDAIHLYQMLLVRL